MIHVTFLKCSTLSYGPVKFRMGPLGGIIEQVCKGRPFFTVSEEAFTKDFG